MIKTLLACLIVLLCWATPGQAQTVCGTPCKITVGSSFTVTATVDGVNTTGYRLKIDNVQVGPDITFGAGTLTIPGLVAPSRGNHTLVVEAFNEDTFTDSAPLAFQTVKPAPNTPGGVKILVTVVIASNGTITLKVAGVENGRD